MPSKPELMSPAGYWPQLQTAIETGADAVYFGLNHFSARGKVGFNLEELPEVMQTLHGRGVKGFVTFNTLVFDHEIELAESAIREMAGVGVDAVIVQDVGMARRIQQIAPEMVVHGSTQMSITSAQGAELAKSLGCSRVVLGRELSLTDIRKIREATDVELEVFVHGALCVSYSGQCFSSEAWGGRSANRGKCAQACRLSYDLIVDGEIRDLGEYRYLLSPGDLDALEQIPELVDIGVSCFKIEGRYKDADYVALTTKTYREAIDLACLNLPNEITDDERLDLEQIYSRGLGAYFISGTNHQTAVIGRAPRHRGVLVGEVASVSSRAVLVNTKRPIQRGDGLVFDAASWRSPDEPEEGGNVYEVKAQIGGGTPLVQLEFGHHEIDFQRIHVGDLVWRTKDPQLNKRLKSITQTQVPIFTRAVRFAVTAKIGLPIEIVATLENGQTATYLGEQPLAAADKRPLDLETLNEKLGRLGGTPYHLDQIDWLTADAVFVRTSELNEARRQLVDELFDADSQIKPIPVTKLAEGSGPSVNSIAADKQDAYATSPRLHLLVRTPEQLDAAIEAATQLNQSATASDLRPSASDSNDPALRNPHAAIASITLDYLELYGLRPSVEKIRAANLRPRVASPRILKPTEQNVVRFLTSLECDILVRSGGLLQDLAPAESGMRNAELQLIGDFSLNAANALSCQAYLNLGLTRITPTYDLNSQQITELTNSISGSVLEVIAYSHLPVFHMEHCVFCRFLSEGTDNTNCGHPCETHRIAVRDQAGRAHPVLADVGCRNTVFGAEAQCDAQAITRWVAAGISDYRLEFVHQSPEQVSGIAIAFYEYLNQNLERSQFEKRLQEHSPQSTTLGSLFVPADFKQLVQLG
jgi:putative protease